MKDKVFGAPVQDIGRPSHWYKHSYNAQESGGEECPQGTVVEVYFAAFFSHISTPVPGILRYQCGLGESPANFK